MKTHHKPVIEKAPDGIREFIAGFTKEDLVRAPIVVVPVFQNHWLLEGLINSLRLIGLTKFLLLDGSMRQLAFHSIDEDLHIHHAYVGANPGPRYFAQNKALYETLPKWFIVTDPDIRLGPQFPSDGISTFIKVSTELKVGKVATALRIPQYENPEEYFFGGRWQTIEKWEAQFWREKIENSLELEVFRANTDTTFALYNKQYFSPASFFEAVRVAGDFTSLHLPWEPDWKSIEGSRNLHSTWDNSLSIERLRRAVELQQDRIDRLHASMSWKLTAPLRQVRRFFLRAIGRR